MTRHFIAIALLANPACESSGTASPAEDGTVATEQVGGPNEASLGPSAEPASTAAPQPTGEAAAASAAPATGSSAPAVASGAAPLASGAASAAAGPACRLGGTPHTPSGDCSFRVDACCYTTFETACSAAGCAKGKCVLLKSYPAQASCVE